MYAIDLATGFKIGMYRESVTNAFPRPTDIIQVLNELQTDKRHIKVLQEKYSFDFLNHMAQI